MTASLATITFDMPRPSARVKTVASAYFDADESQVRRLIKSGELEKHTIGKRGVRVYLDSVAAYQQRHTKARTTPPQSDASGANGTAPKPAAASRAAHRAALAKLHALGVL